MVHFTTSTNWGNPLSKVLPENLERDKFYFNEVKLVVQELK